MSERSRKRIALYGGTFDPVHNGHIAVAERLLELFALDAVLFIPAHLAPHKRERRVASGWHRYAMLALATAEDERLRISTVELDEPERPYTVETLSRLREEMGRGVRLFFIMGADSWSEITTWREWQRLLTLTDQIVVTRPGYELDYSHVTEEVRARIVDVRGLDREKHAPLIEGEAEEARVYVTDAILMDVSATEVRRAVREGHEGDLIGLIPGRVARYLKKYGLYRD